MPIKPQLLLQARHRACSSRFRMFLYIKSCIHFVSGVSSRQSKQHHHHRSALSSDLSPAVTSFTKYRVKGLLPKRFSCGTILSVLRLCICPRLPSAIVPEHQIKRQPITQRQMAFVFRHNNNLTASYQVCVDVSVWILPWCFARCSELTWTGEQKFDYLQQAKFKNVPMLHKFAVQAKKKNWAGPPRGNQG